KQSGGYPRTGFFRAAVRDCLCFRHTATAMVLSLTDLPTQLFDNRLHIVHASAPRSAAGGLQCRPEARVGGEAGVGLEIFPRWARGEQARAFGGGGRPALFA